MTNQEFFDNWRNYGFSINGNITKFADLFIDVSWHPTLTETIVFHNESNLGNFLFKIDQNGDLFSVNSDPPHAESQISKLIDVRE